MKEWVPPIEWELSEARSIFGDWAYDGWPTDVLQFWV